MQTFYTCGTRVNRNQGRQEKTITLAGFLRAGRVASVRRKNGVFFTGFLTKGFMMPSGQFIDRKPMITAKPRVSLRSKKIPAALLFALIFISPALLHAQEIPPERSACLPPCLLSSGLNKVRRRP